MNFFAIFFGIFLPGSSMYGIRASNFFLAFSAYLIPFWLKLMLERGFLNFFAIIFGIFLPGSSMNGIRDENFFLSFSANLIPYWLKIIPVIGFFIFWIFLLFFSEFSCSGRVGTEFRTKIFFSLSRPISSRFG